MERQGQKKKNWTALIRTLVFFTFLYGTEIFLECKRDALMIDVYEMLVKRRMLRIPRTALITNTSIFDKLRIGTRVRCLQTYTTLPWLHHVQIRYVERLTIHNYPWLDSGKPNSTNFLHKGHYISATRSQRKRALCF